MQRVDLKPLFHLLLLRRVSDDYRCCYVVLNKSLDSHWVLVQIGSICLPDQYLAWRLCGSETHLNVQGLEYSYSASLSTTTRSKTQTTLNCSTTIAKSCSVSHETTTSPRNHPRSPLTMILRCLLFLVALVPYVAADVKFKGPAAGSTITGTTITISWEESGDSPPISELASYQIFLCAGGNSATDYVPLATLVTTGNFAKGNSVTASFTTGLGAPTANAYFLKMISAATGGVVINYSDRFTLASMAGTFPAAVTAGLKTVTGTAGPPTENQIQAPQVGATATAAAGAAQYGTPYTLQTGAIRYAPMPPMAQSKITAKNASPQFPTSSYTPYVTIAGSPNAISTQTAPETFSTVSRENTVS